MNSAHKPFLLFGSDGFGAIIWLPNIFKVIYDCLWNHKGIKYLETIHIIIFPIIFIAAFIRSGIGFGDSLIVIACPFIHMDKKN
jgi:hypothetical protein